MKGSTHTKDIPVSSFACKEEKKGKISIGSEGRKKRETERVMREGRRWIMMDEERYMGIMI